MCITHAVCTVTERNGVRLRASFGDTLKGTQALKLTVECLIDVKRNVTLPVDLEVEVGVPSTLLISARSAGRARCSSTCSSDTDSTRDGYTLTVLLTENARHYPYLDSDWQQAAAHYARLHVYNSLVARGYVYPDPGTRVHGHAARFCARGSLVGVIATSPVKPLNVLVRNQSAKGLAVHLLVNPLPTLVLFKSTRICDASPESPFRPAVAGPALASTPHGPSGVNCMLGGRPVDV